jgi:hypothetical protein
LTSELPWRSAWIAALIDAPLILLIARLVPSELFQKLKWYLAGAGFFGYSVVWGVFGAFFFWEMVVRAIFPA